MLISCLSFIILSTVAFRCAFSQTTKIYDRVNLHNPSGSFASPRDFDGEIKATFLIRARKGTRISLRFNVFDLDGADGDYVMIRDGRRSQVEFIYRKRGDDIILQTTPRRDDDRDGPIQHPIQINAGTKRLFITYYTGDNRGKDGFEAYYETYPDSFCQKSALPDNLPGLQCEGEYTIAPLAGNCVYEKNCGGGFTQNGGLKCEYAIEWTDTTTCIARGELVDQCDFDEENGLSNCPYTVEEVARYYISIDESDNYENFVGVHERGSGPLTGTCRKPCARLRSGKYKQKRCNRRGGYRNYAVCIMCRWRGKCKRSHVLFP